jgi:Xaa-Pro aminopeptidase
MRKSVFDIAVTRERRNRLAEAMNAKGRGATLVLPAHPQFIRNNDVHHNYRADSNMLYFTGYEEASCVLVFRPGQQPETTMFVHPKDPLRETWEGFLFGPDAAKTEYGFDQTHPIEKFDEIFPTLIADSDKIYYATYLDREFDERLHRLLHRLAEGRSRTNKGNVAIEDPRALFGELRIRKDAYEIALMKKAGDITAAAHRKVMKHCRPGLNERALQGLFIQSILEQGCAREGYNSILAGGANATTLHYVFNDQPLKDGDMFLIDAGGEYKYYTADITRTYPVNGRFSADQKRVYQKVLTLQKDLVQMVKPGQTREGLQKHTIERLTDLMIEERLLKGTRAENIEKKTYMKYYMHGVGHWLGLDVHDAGTLQVNGEPRQFEKGVCLTIEPGLYIPADDKDAPSGLKGFGVRIEDNILVTEAGHDNLTAACPKEVDELEGLIGTA